MHETVQNVHRGEINNKITDVMIYEGDVLLSNGGGTYKHKRERERKRRRWNV